ncbi:MAG: GNAT family N-acetyltransferase [Hamadaea sp.]|nr:GNAT family N-acetyltransferase [Hamadaea sp.]
MDTKAWPLFDLRLRAGDLTLRPTTEADLPALAAMQPVDVEQDPSLPAYGPVDAPLTRAARTFQFYWRSWGSWRPDAWTLGFLVERDGRIIGEQSLEARDFARIGTVETASWLLTTERGQGLGKLMRIAVLTLAFEGLGAATAETEAWHHNVASLGVSRAVGYEPNGVYRHATNDAGGADDMVRMRLTAARWRALHPAPDVTIEGLTPCLPYFGR